jgi:hypothetical protein
LNLRGKLAQGARRRLRRKKEKEEKEQERSNIIVNVIRIQIFKFFESQRGRVSFHRIGKNTMGTLPSRAVWASERSCSIVS